MNCTLSEDINQCEFFIRNECRCTNPGICTFQQDPEQIKQPAYVRTERWYEKYYK